jgi:hypothetical protein
MMNNKPYKLILALFTALLLSGGVFGQGFVERHIKGTEDVETNLHFIYQGVHIPVLDQTYHEFSADSLTWRKSYEEGDCYIRFNNYTDNSVNPYTGYEGYHPDSGWWVFNFCTCNGAIPDNIGGVDTMFVYYYQTDTTYIIDTVVVQNDALDINIPFPDTVSGSTVNYQDTTYHTHELYVFIGDNEDVDTTGRFDGAVLKWNAVSEMWEVSSDLIGTGGGASLRVTEEDNNPSVDNVTEIRVTNSHLTNNGTGSVSLDLTIDANEAENDFFRTGKVRVPSGDNFITFSSALPDTDYVVASVYAQLDWQQARQSLWYDSLAVDGFRVLDVVDSAYVHYIAIRDLDSLLLALNGTGLVYASGADTTLGFLSNSVDDSTITVSNNELHVLDTALYHNNLRNLNWADAGHTMDDTLEMNGYNVDQVGVVGMDTSYTVLGSEPIGSIYWDSDNGTYSYVFENGVIGQNFFEEYFRVKNETGAQIDNGTPVMYSGSIGASGNPKVVKAIADGTKAPWTFLGVATEDIANGGWGLVSWRGIVRGIDTDGSPYGETWSAGDTIYVSSATAGYLTNVQPSAPNYTIWVAIVSSAGNNGSLLIRPSWDSKITDAADVNGTPLTESGQFLVWNNDSSYFDPTWNVDTFKVLDALYGEMYKYEDTTAAVIGTQDTYHAVVNFTQGSQNGVTYVAGAEGSFTAVADYSGTVAGTVLITDVGHGLSTGDILTIHNTTNYNGVFEITVVDPDSYYITDTYVATETGDWAAGDYLRCDVAGVYMATFHATAFAAAANTQFKFELFKNTTELNNIAASRMFSSTDYGSISGHGVVTLAVGDRVWFAVMNRTSSTDITVRHANVTINRL